MKKFLCILLLIIMILVGTLSCENKVPKKSNEMPEKISDYFPFEKNILKVYEDYGNEYGEQTIFFDYIDDNKGQLRTINPGTIIISVLEYTGGELREIHSEEEFYHIENKIKTNRIKNHILLKEPLKVGTNWTLPNGNKRAITGSDVEVETPIKKYKALEVTTEYGNNKKQLDYYVKKVGHVARIYNDNNVEVKTLLKTVEKDKPYILKLRFYYPVVNDTKIVFVEKKVDFNTNDRIEDIIEREFKNISTNKIIPPISPNTKIKSIKVDERESLVKINFSKELIEEMKVKDTLEMQKIRSIVNTLGNYYGVSKVYISAENKPYKTKNFTLKEDEYFTVDDISIEKLR